MLFLVLLNHNIKIPNSIWSIHLESMFFVSVSLMYLFFGFLLWKAFSTWVLGLWCKISYGEGRSKWMSLISQEQCLLCSASNLTTLCFHNVPCECLTQSSFCFLVQFSNQRHPRGYTWSKEGAGRAAACRREVYVCGDLTQDFWGKVIARRVSFFFF